MERRVRFRFMTGRAAVISVVAVIALLITPLAALVRVGAGAVEALHPAPLDLHGQAVDSPTVQATYTGTFELTDRPRGLFARVPLGGLSGMDCAGTRCLALSDDRGRRGPVRAYPLELTGAGAVVGDPLVLSDRDGVPYRPGAVDPESIRLTPDGMVWGSEGDESLGAPAAVTAADADGRARFTYDLPDYHRLRPNAGYEALAVRGDETLVLTEAPLRQDALNRLTVYDRATGTPTAEYAYPLSPVPGVTTGASEMLALPDGSLLTLERGWREDLGNVATLYRVTLDGASDVLGETRVPDAAHPVHKERLLDLGAAVGTRNLDNVESLAWAAGTLLIGTDDNFSPSQRSLVHTVTLTGIGG
jgi:hypothetical protein